MSISSENNEKEVHSLIPFLFPDDPPSHLLSEGINYFFKFLRF